MENKLLIDYAEEILDVEWDVEDDHLVYYFDNSNEYGDAYNQVIQVENLDPVEEEDSISLFTTSFS